MGEGKTRFLYLRPMGFLEGTSIGIGSAICETSLYEGCEGPPTSASFVPMLSLSIIVPFFFSLTYGYIVLSTGVGLCILDCGVGEMFN
jgi:hypothetical protein